MSERCPCCDYEVRIAADENDRDHYEPVDAAIRRICTVLDNDEGGAELYEAALELYPLRFIIEGFDPDWSVHPGETIRDLLTARAWSQAEFARMCGISPKHMSRVITGKAGIGPDFALRLEAATSVSAAFWARFQAAHDVHVARQRAAPVSKETRLAPDLSDDPEGEHCYDCGAAVSVVWTAPDDMWSTVAGRPDGGGLLCVRCFDKRAEQQGMFLRWIPHHAAHERSAEAAPLDVDVLAQHYVTAIECDHEAQIIAALSVAGTDTVRCSCSVWTGTPQPSVGAAAREWADHVARLLAAAPSPAAEAEKSPFQRVVDDLTGGCGCGCHTGIGYNAACGHCVPRASGNAR